MLRTPPPYSLARRFAAGLLVWPVRAEGYSECVMCLNVPRAGMAFGWQGYPPLARSRGGPVESKYGNLGTRRVGCLNFDPFGLTHA